jgi:hypothetical protein
MIRNLDAFQVFVDTILSLTSSDESSNSDTQPSPKDILRQGMLQSLDRCIRANPVNYFITIPVNALPLLLEKMYAFDEKSQVGVK